MSDDSTPQALTGETEREQALSAAKSLEEDAGKRCMPCPEGERAGRPPEPTLWGKALRLVVFTCFWPIAKARLRIRIRGLEHLRNAPGTIVAGTHSSYFDPLVGLPLFLILCRWRGPLSRAWVVANEDLFLPGMFSIAGLNRPRWFSRFLYRLDLTRVVQQLRFHPMPFAELRLIRSHLTDVIELLGNRPLEAVLRHPPGEMFPSAAPGASVASVIDWEHRAALYRRAPFSVFRTEAEEALRKRHRIRIADNLRAFASLLDEGQAVLIAPQALTQYGHIRNLKSGLLQIVQSTHRDIAVFPLNMSYDPMTTGRVRTFIRLGPPLHNVREFNRQQYETEMSRALAALGTVTLSHIAGSVLCRLARDGEDVVAESVLKARVLADAQELRDEGFTVDPLLATGRAFERRWSRFMTYCRRRDLAVCENGLFRFDPGPVLAPPAADRVPVHPWQMSSNELESILDAVRPDSGQERSSLENASSGDGPR